MKNKVVIITGGSSGIGKALAYEFGSKGSKVVITGRKKEALLKTSQELDAAGIENIFIVADVANRIENELVINQTLTKFGQKSNYKVRS